MQLSGAPKSGPIISSQPQAAVCPIHSYFQAIDSSHSAVKLSSTSHLVHDCWWVGHCLPWEATACLKVNLVVWEGSWGTEATCSPRLLALTALNCGREQLFDGSSSCLLRRDPRPARPAVLACERLHTQSADARCALKRNVVQRRDRPRQNDCRLAPIHQLILLASSSEYICAAAKKGLL